MQKLQPSALNRLPADDFRGAVKAPLIVVLDNIRSALNVGSVFRTADAFLVEKIILCGITAVPPHKDILKTALGATETVHWEYTARAEVAILNLKRSGCQIVAVEQTDSSISLSDFSPVPQTKTVLIFGHEVNGVEASLLQHCDAAIEIPQFGSKHSLNIAVCAGIVIWDLFAKCKKN